MLKVALLVGVSEYQPGLQLLPSAIEDVRAMERVLQHPEMGGFDKVEVLTNPTIQKMREAIYNLFAERSPEDLVLFYFSGHGVKDQNRNLYLTTPETTKSPKGLVVPYTAVKASYLQEQMNDSRSEREVIMLDCCYSGAIAKGLTAKDEGAVDIIAELGGKGRAILTSSTSVQSSFQQEGTLSIYTQYLVEGIETGAADLNSDGLISADELHQYANKNVQQASPAMTPQFYPVEEGYRINLARSPQDDPKLKYRKEAQIRAEKGEFTLIGRRILDRRRIELGLSQEEAETIEGEILRPYREYQQKLQEYKQAFREVVEQEYPLSDYTRNELKDFQKLLELRDEDVAPIEARFTPQPKPKTETEPEVTRSVSDPKPTVENNSQLTPRQTETQSLQVFEFDVVTVEVEVQRSGLFGLGSKVTLNKNRSQSQARYFTENLGNEIALDLVAIPGGKFLMGTEDEEIERLCKKYDVDYFRSEKPQHEVTVQPLFMGKYPVTQAQWRAIAFREDLKVERDLDPNPAYFKDREDSDRRPVETVSWEDAVEFCDRLSQHTEREYRLPSEAEWEYACRAETITPFHFGETISTDLANYRGTDWQYKGKVYPGNYGRGSKGSFREQTTPVGYFKVANNFGLYDMHGNVWEWCEDDWHDNYPGAPTNGSAWLSGQHNLKVVRGGSWNYNPDNCRCADRSCDTRDNRSRSFGFRVVCVAPRTT